MKTAVKVAGQISVATFRLGSGYPSPAKCHRINGEQASKHAVAQPAGNTRNNGFTLIEMVVVITLILILVAIALPMYSQQILRAKEAKLHQNLNTLNKVIEEYSLDKKHAPQSLQDLIPGYLKFIPDDITGSPDTWKLDQEDPQDAMDANQTGIVGVHSGSDEVSSEGTPYSSWTH